MPSPRVLVIVDRQQGTLNNLIAVGPDNYVNQILEIAGGTNVLAKPGLPQYPHISLETVLRENPDVIIDLSSTQETEAARRASRAATLALWKSVSGPKGSEEWSCLRWNHRLSGCSRPANPDRCAAALRFRPRHRRFRLNRLLEIEDVSFSYGNRSRSRFH